VIARIRETTKAIQALKLVRKKRRAVALLRHLEPHFQDLFTKHETQSYSGVVIKRPNDGGHRLRWAAGLVRDTEPFREARFLCRESTRFVRIAVDGRRAAQLDLESAHQANHF
jgi:hypothetical protein